MPFNRQRNLEMGKLSESICKPVIEDDLGFSITKIRQTYSQHDYESIDSPKKTYIELKSRSCYHNTFDTDLISDDKWFYLWGKFKDGFDVYIYYLFRNNRLHKYKFHENSMDDLKTIQTSFTGDSRRDYQIVQQGHKFICNYKVKKGVFKFLKYI